ncbi:hypothetical protein Pyn_04151 [Prunus yedoensis var. nudiflora]|uniref:Uncharacterized protein n=1 Tax=Prunus yedoensis var. nudiflora TaxID=2094558 RepID=A0A314UHX5_PRUYE|nr:hypothetical protein Pyn_04151 [Prunus yedoensis var. nudiflora]
MRRRKSQCVGGCVLELPFGNIGKVSGKGISQFSPLKYTLLGKAHPFLNVNDSESFSKSISVDTEPTPSLSVAISSSLTKAIPQKRATASATVSNV